MHFSTICEIIVLVGGPWKMVAIFCMNPEEACALDARLGNRSALIYPRSAPEVPL